MNANNDETPGAATPRETPSQFASGTAAGAAARAMSSRDFFGEPLEDTSALFLGVEIVRHRRRGHERVTLYFPREIRALDVSPEEAKELAAEIVALAELPREVIGDVAGEVPNLGRQLCRITGTGLDPLRKLLDFAQVRLERLRRVDAVTK